MNMLEFMVITINCEMKYKDLNHRDYMKYIDMNTNLKEHGLEIKLPERKLKPDKLFNDGNFSEALLLYEQIHDYERCGDCSNKIDQVDKAVDFYTKGAILYVDRNDFTKALEFTRDKIPDHVENVAKLCVDTRILKGEYKNAYEFAKTERFNSFCDEIATLAVKYFEENNEYDEAAEFSNLLKNDEYALELVLKIPDYELASKYSLLLKRPLDAIEYCKKADDYIAAARIADTYNYEELCDKLLQEGASRGQYAGGMFGFIRKRDRAHIRM